MADPHPATDQRLSFALAIAESASTLILSHYQTSSLKVDYKSDASPVTLADRGAEELMRKEILAEFPEDGVLGEEYGETPSRNGFRWILDPIDGTKAFVHGVHQFGTLIGIEHQGRMVAGVCRFPAFEEVIYAQRGGGAWRMRRGNAPERCQVTDTSELNEALFCFTEISGWHEIGRADALEKLWKSSRIARGWGDCFGHMLVATGRADVMVDPQMNSWDAAALLPIVEEAGGHFIDWNGTASIYSGNGLSVNEHLTAAVLDCLKRPTC